MKKSIFSKFVFLSVLSLFSSYSNLYSYIGDTCVCKVRICSCCQEERTYQFFFIDGTPGGVFTTNDHGCAPSGGAFNLPCYTSFYILEVGDECGDHLPVPTYFTTCTCTAPNAGGEMTVMVPCCPKGDGNRTNTDIKHGIPNDFKLNQNFPNPFNPTTKIDFELPQASNVTIAVYDVTGKLIEVLLNAFTSAGYHSVVWNTNNLNLSSGVYFCKLEAGNFSDEKKMVLVK